VKLETDHLDPADGVQRSEGTALVSWLVAAMIIETNELKAFDPAARFCFAGTQNSVRFEALKCKP